MRVGTTALLATVAALMTGAGTAQAADGCRAPRSWWAGGTALCHGTLVHGDYVDDDFGADTGAAMTTARTALLAPSAGDQGYPPGQDATADLVRLTVEPRGDRLVVTALLNALYDPRSTVLAVAIDTDDDPATGGGPWPGLRVRSSGWDQFTALDAGDPATNTIRGTVPRPAGRAWRLQAATAIRATGQVMNVAFRGTGEHAGWTLRSGLASAAGTWFEDDQAAALRTGDISRFGLHVDARDLRARVTRPATAGPGLHERVYTSAYTVAPGEGVRVAGVPGRGDGGPNVQAFQYLGRFQPYGVYVPPGPGPHGLQLVAHGSNSAIAGLINQPGMQARFGDALNRVLVVPEARGSEGFGSDISERDVLDVLDDVQTALPVDPDRVVAGGYSQGGYVALRLAALHPDRFAGVVTWVAYTGNLLAGTPLEGLGLTGGAVGDVLPLVGNLRHVPAVLLYAGADELVPVNVADAARRAFAASDDVFRVTVHPLADHLTLALLDDWRTEAAATAGLRRVRMPARVSFRTSATLDDPAHGIRHDRAYWVRGIRPRVGPTSTVDLTTSACGVTAPHLASAAISGSRPLPWVGSEQRVAGTTALPRRRALEGNLENVASLRVATTAACVGRRAFTYRLHTDGPAVIAVGGRRVRLPAAGTFDGTVPAAPKGHHP